MSRLVKSVVREVISHTPYLRTRYYHWQFLRREQTFKGVYPSFQAALADAPDQRLLGYNHKEIARINEEGIDQLNPADYPILFWLSPLLPETSRIFDLGGNIGVAYYAYRRYLTYPPQLRWLVCEVPQTVIAGRELAQRKGAGQLSFTDLREDAEDASVYFTAGALQYIEEPFADVIGALRQRPRHLLINRVPLCDRPSFITLQNNGAWVVPYKVTNKAEFIESILSLGYELMDHWQITRSLEVLMHPDYNVPHYHGLYFRLKQP